MQLNAADVPRFAHTKTTLASKPRGSTPLDPTAFRLSVLIPVYNELNTIDTILDRVRATDVVKEIICVDDCSTDGTRERLIELRDAGFIDRLIFQQRNGGKGKAIRTAISASTGDVVIVQDADLEYDPHDWGALLFPIVNGNADACFGYACIADVATAGEAPGSRNRNALVPEVGRGDFARRLVTAASNETDQKREQANAGSHHRRLPRLRELSARSRLHFSNQIGAETNTSVSFCRATATK